MLDYKEKRIMKTNCLSRILPALALSAAMLILGTAGCIDKGDYADDDETDVHDDAGDADDSDTTAAFSSSASITFTFSGNSVAIEGTRDSVSVVKDGADVTVTSEAAGMTYKLKGETGDGSFKIYSTQGFELSLDGISMTSSGGAAINSQSSRKCIITAAAGSVNSLADASSRNTPSDEDEKGCIFSEGQLVFTGGGKLTVDGNFKHGICSDDYIIVESGTSISVKSAATDGIHVKEYFRQNGGAVSVVSSSDCIDCEEGNIELKDGSLTASTDGAAKRCLKAAAYIDIDGGVQNLTTSGGGEYDSEESDAKSAACIRCGTDFTFDGATATLKSTGTGGKGVNADGAVTIGSGSLSVVTTGKQYSYGSGSTGGGIFGGGGGSSDNTSGAKGIKCDGALTINGGETTVSATGGEGSEGIESKSTITINDGTVIVNTYDDAINASSDLTVNGGRIYACSSGNDAFDANGSFLFTGGLSIAVGTTTPEDGFDCDQGTFAITGGVLLGFGGGTSTPTSSSCTQRSVLYGGIGKNLVTVKDSDGNCLFSFNLSITYSSALMLFSSPSLKDGGTYSIYTGGGASGGTAFEGYTSGGTLTGGTQAGTFTCSSMVTSVNAGGTGGGGGGGNPGGGGGGGGRP